MLVSGLSTCTMFIAVINPEVALNNTFGESISGSIANIVVRSWGALITLIGLMLIYGAFAPKYQIFIAAFAGLSKFIWVSLLLFFGHQFFDKTVVVIVFDLLVALMLYLFIFASWKRPN